MVCGITESSGFQIAARSRFLRRPVNTGGYVARMHEMLPQMRDMLEKDNLVPERDVIEEHEMLVKLPHISDVRNDRNAKSPAEQADGNEFTDTSDSHRVHLDKS